MYRRDLVVLSLGDEELMNRLRRTASNERKVQSQFLAYLAAVERRKLYAEAGYSSLYKFLVQELNYSESSALKRIQVARVAARLPLLYLFLEEGKLSLTALSKLAPHLTEANHEDWLKSCEKKTVAEVETMLAKHYPKKSDSPDKITPLDDETDDIHFTAPKAFSEKLRKAKALLSHRYPKGRSAEILGEALDELLKTLAPKVSKRKQAPTSPDSRYIPQVIRAEVWKRDQGKCSYVSSSGHRCEETHFLEFDHRYPWALGGEHDLRNIRLLCRTHNAFVAETFFSRAFLDEKRNPQLCTQSWGDKPATHPG